MSIISSLACEWYQSSKAIATNRTGGNWAFISGTAARLKDRSAQCTTRLVLYLPFGLARMTASWHVLLPVVRLESHGREERLS